MLSVLYFVALSILAVLALTRHRMLVICSFYSFYALVTVLDPNDVPHIGPVSVYRALYLIALISFVARLVQDSNFLNQIRRWPLTSYFFLLILIVASSLYSQTARAFSSTDLPTVWDIIAVFSLFWLTAAQVQREADLKLIAGTTVVVALVLSAWVIWNAARLNFTVLRGGIEVNQNYVSDFVLLGAISLINVVLVSKRLWVKLVSLLPLLLIMAASLILASRGLFIAFLVAVIWMAATALRGASRKTLLGVIAALVLIFCIALLLPGGTSLFARFGQVDVGTLDERTPIWEQSFRHFRESGLTRMIFGQGLSSITFVVGPYLSGENFMNYHNQYLKFLMEQGVVGATAFLVFLYGMVHRIRRSGHSVKPVMIGWMGFLLVNGLSNTIADAHEFWFLFGVMAGVCALPYPLTTRPQAKMISTV